MLPDGYDIIVDKPIHKFTGVTFFPREGANRNSCASPNQPLAPQTFIKGEYGCRME